MVEANWIPASQALSLQQSTGKALPDKSDMSSVESQHLPNSGARRGVRYWINIGGVGECWLVGQTRKASASRKGGPPPLSAVIRQIDNCFAILATFRV